jgi:hypothetical protein
MKKALISSIEFVTNFDNTTGYRVAQVENESDIFEVAEGMFWVDCPNETIADHWYFDTTTKTVIVKPIQSTQSQPTSSGVTTL